MCGRNGCGTERLRTPRPGDMLKESLSHGRRIMRRLGHLAGIALVFGAILGAGRPAGAQDEPFPVALRVGETFDVCASGQVACPARTSICDDLKVAVPVDLPGGLGFQGVGPGTTLCSAASAIGPRRVFRITVR